MSAVTIIASPYDTSGNGGRKLIVLSNGWLISSFYNTSTIYFYKSTDSGATWTQITFVSNVNLGYAIASSGTNVYCAFSDASGQLPGFIKFGATTVANTDQLANKVMIVPVSFTNMLTNVGMAVAPNGNITVAWTAIISSSPNSFNLFSARSPDGGATWTKVDGTAGYNQLTGLSTSGHNVMRACVTINASNVPFIYADIIDSQYSIAVFTTNYTTGNFISNWDGAFGNRQVGTATLGSNQQLNVNAIVKKTGSNIGRLWASWYGYDPTDSSRYNIHASWSDDGGVTWSTYIKITSGNSLDRINPTLGENTNGDIYVFYQDSLSLSYQVCANGTTTFSGTTSFAAATDYYPSAQELASSAMLGVIYRNSSAVIFDKLVFNTAPNAPTPSYPLYGGYYNSRTQPVGWTFSDPDAGNTQSAYQIQVTTDSTFATINGYDTGKVISSANSYAGAPVSADGTWYYRIRTWDNSDAVGPYSVPSNWFFIDTVAPNAPTLTIGTITGTSVALSWTAAVDPAPSSGIAITGVYMRKWNGSSWIDIAGSPVNLSGAQTSYTYTGLTPNTIYHAIIQYKDNAGNYGSYPEIPFITNTSQLFFGSEF